MPEILILADDLSGAADCAGGCAAAGLECLVLLAPDVATEATPAVIAIDLDTRGKPAWEAGLTLGRVIERVGNTAIRVFYHKIDSTLRGAWAQQLAVALKSLGATIGAPPLALVAPAFPARGRITRVGRMLVHAPSAAHERASP